MRRGFCENHLLLLSCALGAAIAGCQAPQAAAPQPQRIAEASATGAADAIQKAPVAFLEKMAARAEKLDEYELTFYRQERLGTFVPKLAAMEQIHAKFRRRPFSVTFEWPRNDSDYYWSVYVDGQNNNKLIVKERRGVLGLPPQTRVVNVSDPVTFGRSKSPITDFGFEQLMLQTLRSFRDPAIRPLMSVRYEGMVNLDPMNTPAYHLRIERPASPGIQYTRQDFFIDAATLLPAGTDLYLPDGKLDARYRYTGVNTNARLTDADFQPRRRAG